VHLDWAKWTQAPVHQDGVSVICDENKRSELLKRAAFICDHDVSTGNVMYHSVLSSWSPSAKHAGIDPEAHPMIMSQSLHPQILLNSAKVVRHFSAPRSHPDLSMRNMVITQMLHHLQGLNGIYFCGNWTAPGNGHDLSLTSGLVVASAIVGRDFYPFTNDAARRDFELMRRFMGLG
jgi:hypothetical protein